MHELYTITSYEIVAPYTLHLTFDDGTEKTIDLLPVLRRELFSPLRDLDFFHQVRLDPEVGTIVWPNEADFDPATLHDRDEVGAEFIEMASKWEENPQLVENMTFEQILHSARRLGPSEQIKLLRVLAQDLENYADEIAPIEPFKTYHIYTPFFAPGTAQELMDALEEQKKEQQEQEPK